MIKRTLPSAAALALLALGCAAPARAACSGGCVQIVTANCAAATTCTVTIASTGSGHALLIAAVNPDNSSTANSVPTVTSGATFTCPLNQAEYDGHRDAMICYALAISSGITSVKMNWAASGSAAVIVEERSDLLSSGALDAYTTSMNNVSTNPWNSNSVTPTSGHAEYLFGLEYNTTNQSQSFTGTGSWTAESSVGDTHGGDTLGMSDRIVASTSGSYDNTGTTSPSTGAYSAMATFKQVAAATCAPSLALLGAGAC